MLLGFKDLLRKFWSVKLWKLNILFELPPQLDSKNSFNKLNHWRLGAVWMSHDLRGKRSIRLKRGRSYKEERRWWVGWYSSYISILFKECPSSPTSSTRQSTVSTGKRVRLLSTRPILWEGNTLLLRTRTPRTQNHLTSILSSSYGPAIAWTSPLAIIQNHWQIMTQQSNRGDSPPKPHNYKTIFCKFYA